MLEQLEAAAAEARTGCTRLQVLSQISGAASLDTPAAIRMDENITQFEDMLGTCERILRTPIPLAYTR